MVDQNETPALDVTTQPAREASPEEQTPEGLERSEKAAFERIFAGEDDEAVRQPGELRELAAVLQGEERLGEEPLFHAPGYDDRVPVLVVVVGG